MRSPRTRSNTSARSAVYARLARAAALSVVLHAVVLAIVAHGGVTRQEAPLLTEALASGASDMPFTIRAAVVTVAAPPARTVAAAAATRARSQSDGEGEDTPPRPGSPAPQTGGVVMDQPSQPEAASRDAVEAVPPAPVAPASPGTTAPVAMPTTMAAAGPERPPAAGSAASEAAGALVPEPVETPPEPRTPIEPLYPHRARRRGLEGVVLVRAAIAISGAVTHVDVIESSGYELLDEAAREAVRTASFHAGRVGTVARAMNVDIRLVFRLE